MHKLSGMVHLQRFWKATTFVNLWIFRRYPPPQISLLTLTVTALFPVISWQAVITLGPRGTIFALAEARAVTPVMNRTHLVAVTL